MSLWHNVDGQLFKARRVLWQVINLLFEAQTSQKSSGQVHNTDTKIDTKASSQRRSNIDTCRQKSASASFTAELLRAGQPRKGDYTPTTNISIGLCRTHRIISYRRRWQLQIKKSANLAEYNTNQQNVVIHNEEANRSIDDKESEKYRCTPGPGTNR